MQFWTLQVEVILCEATSSACNAGLLPVKVGLNKCSEVVNNMWLFTFYRCHLMSGIVVMHLSYSACHPSSNRVQYQSAAQVTSVVHQLRSRIALRLTTRSTRATPHQCIHVLLLLCTQLTTHSPALLNLANAPVACNTVA